MSRGKMRGQSFVRNVSLKLLMARRSASQVVAPLPEQSCFSEVVTAKLDCIGLVERDCGLSSRWLVDVLDATIATQIVAQETLRDQNVMLSDVGKNIIDDYLEDNVALLDACNALMEKMDMIQKYIDYLTTIIHYVDGGISIGPNNVATLIRTQEIIEECSNLEGQCATLDKCSPKLNKLMGQKAIQLNNDVHEQELHEVLSGSKEVASMGCHLLQRALSFKSRQGALKMKSKLPTTWSSSLNELQSIMNEEAERRKKCSPWMMKELEQMVMDAKMLHDQVKLRKGNVDIDSLRRSCESLEEGIRPLEERVRELYKHLISVRMTLLAILSQN